MQKLNVILTIILFLATPVAADSQDSADAGLIGPESSFYVLETAWDNAAIGFGLVKASAVAQERANEAMLAATNNNSKAVKKSMASYNNIASIMSNKGNLNKLKSTARILTQVKENSGVRENTELKKALEKVEMPEKRNESVNSPSNKVGGAFAGSGRAKPAR